jgi:hypothetical protein
MNKNNTFLNFELASAFNSLFAIRCLLLTISCSLLTIKTANAQEGTRNTNSDKLSGKIMLIPFEPKLYMSEIDQKVNQQTGWKFDQIRENFRHQLDAQIQAKLSKMEPTVSFYTDSAKMAKDLDYIYKTTSLSYDMVDSKTAASTTPSKPKGVKNGQIVVEINNDKKFMNKKINDAELINYLNKKYKSEYFIFINELDITSDINSYDIATDAYQRVVTVHYSIIDKNSKTLIAGIATSTFTSKENNPKKIVTLSFSPIATYIADKFSVISIPKK